MAKSPIDISVIIPVYNEEQNVRPLYSNILRVLKRLNKEYEIIFLDDGSIDNTFEEVKDLHLLDNNVKCIRLRRNFGKSQALAIGFLNVRGNIIVTMDGDLQDDPEEIPRFIEKINEGWDLVSGWKVVRKDPFSKRAASRFFNIVASSVSELAIHDFNCGFKAYKREVLKTIAVYGELHRFIPMIAHSYGFRVCEIAVKHHERRFGETKFGRERYLAGLFDLLSVVFITGYLRKPLHFLGKVSLLSFTIGIILLLYVFVMKFILGQTGTRPSLIISMFFLGSSVQILLFGLLADLIAYTTHRRSFMEEDFVRNKLI